MGRSLPVDGFACFGQYAGICRSGGNRMDTEAYAAGLSAPGLTMRFEEDKEPGERI